MTDDLDRIIATEEAEIARRNALPPRSGDDLTKAFLDMDLNEAERQTVIGWLAASPYSAEEWTGPHPSVRDLDLERRCDLADSLEPPADYYEDHDLWGDDFRAAVSELLRARHAIIDPFEIGGRSREECLRLHRELRDRAERFKDESDEPGDPAA